MIHSFLIVATLVISQFLQVGCSRQDSPRRSHEGAVAGVESDQTQGNSSSSSDPTRSMKGLYSSEPVAFAQQFERFLDAANLESLKARYDGGAKKTVFDSIERAAELIGAKGKASSADRTRILNAYKKALLYGCTTTETLQLRGCRFVSILRAAPSASHLAQEAASEERDVIRSYQILGIASDLATQTNDPRFDVAYLRRAVEMERALADQPNRLQAHREIIDLSMIRLSKYARQSKTLDPEIQSAISALVEEHKVFDFDRARSTEFAAREANLFHLGVRDFVNQEKWKSDLSKMLARPDSIRSLYAPHVSARKKLPQSMGLIAVVPEQFSTFLLESLWLHRITEDEATALYEQYSAQSAISKEQFRQEILDYLRLRFFLSAQRVNDVIIDFFSQPGRYTTGNAFQEGLKEGLKGEAIWTDALKRIEAVRLFRDRNFSDLEHASKINVKLDSFFSSLDHNIKVTTTYPSMLVLCYHLARLQFSLKVRTWTGEIEIDAGTIMKWFMSGDMTPWFSYSQDPKALSADEISSVIYYSLEMGILSRGGVDLGVFVSLLSKQMAASLKTEVERINDAFRTQFEFNPNLDEFKRLCEIQKSRIARSDTRAASPPIKLEDLRYYTIMGYPQSFRDNGTHQSLQWAWRFFDTEAQITRQRLDENVEIIRLEYSRSIDRIAHVQSLIVDHLNLHEIANRADVIKTMETAIAPHRELLFQVYSRMFRHLDTITQCGESLARAETDGQRQILSGLIAHFHDVYKAMKAARARGEVDTLHDDFNFARPGTRESIPDLRAHETRLGYSAKYYRFSQLQALLRMKSLLEDGFIGEDGVKHPPVRDSGSIQLPARLRDMAEGLRTNSYVLEWSDDQEDFVTNAIQQVLRYRSSFLWWLEQDNAAMSIRGRLRSMISIAKLGEVATDKGPRRMTPAEVVRAQLTSEKWIELDPLFHRVLAASGYIGRVSNKIFLDEYTWARNDLTYWGLLDSAFKQFSKEKLGHEGGDRENSRMRDRIGPFEELKKYTLMVKSKGSPLFELPDSYYASINSFYTKRLDQHLEALAELVNVAKSLEAKRKVNPEIFPSWKLYVARTAPDLPLLKPTVVENYRAYVLEYARETGYKVPAAFLEATASP